MKTPANVALLLLAAACGRTLVSSLDGRSSLPPPDAFDCVMKAFETEGFRRTSFDKEELRTTARKENPKITFSDIAFRKAHDVLEVDIGSGAGGETEVKVTASTVAEYFSQVGQTFEPLQPSGEAQEAARSIAARCGG